MIIDSLDPGPREADLDAAGGDFGIFLLAHEVDLGRTDVAVPGEFPHSVHGRRVSDRVVDRRSTLGNNLRRNVRQQARHPGLVAKRCDTAYSMSSVAVREARYGPNRNAVGIDGFTVFAVTLSGIDRAEESVVCEDPHRSGRHP
jgi:hypothetical protein